MTYVPGGRPLIVNVPSSPVTAKKGWPTTPMYARIQGCTLHFTGIMTSWRAKLFVIGACPGDCDSFQSGLTVGCGGILWLVGSLVLISKFWPVITPITRGLYMQPFWSRLTWVVGTAHCLSAGSPDFTQTKAFFRVPLSLTTTSSLFCGAPLWARSQAGLADMSSVAIFGFSPVNATFPVMVPPLASSGGDTPPPAGAVASLLAVSAGLSPPHPASVRLAARTAPIQIFFITLLSLPRSEERRVWKEC